MMYSKSQSDEQRTEESHLNEGNNNLDNMMERKSEVEKEQASAAKKSLRGELHEPPVASNIRTRPIKMPGDSNTPHAARHFTRLEAQASLSHAQDMLKTILWTA